MVKSGAMALSNERGHDVFALVAEGMRKNAKRKAATSVRNIGKWWNVKRWRPEREASIRTNSHISTVIRGYTPDALFHNFGAMPYGQSYRKQAQLLGVLLALADSNLHHRAVVLHEIRETIAGLKRKSPIFAPRLFARVVARTAFPANREKELDALAELVGDSEPKIERVA